MRKGGISLSYEIPRHSRKTHVVEESGTFTETLQSSIIITLINTYTPLRVSLLHGPPSNGSSSRPYLPFGHWTDIPPFRPRSSHRNGQTGERDQDTCLPCPCPCLPCLLVPPFREGPHTDSHRTPLKHHHRDQSKMLNLIQNLGIYTM